MGVVARIKRTPAGTWLIETLDNGPKLIGTPGRVVRSQGHGDGERQIEMRGLPYWLSLVEIRERKLGAKKRRLIRTRGGVAER